MRPYIRALFTALLVAVVLAGASTVVLAGGDASAHERVGSVAVAIEDERVHVTDVDVSGDGLPSVQIDERTYTIDSASLHVDGATVAYGDTTYEVGSIDVRVENVGVTLEDVSIGGN